MRQRDDITLPDAIDGLKDAYISLRNIKNDISIVMSHIEEIIYDDEENDEEDMYYTKDDASMYITYNSDLKTCNATIEYYDHHEASNDDSKMVSVSIPEELIKELIGIVNTSDRNLRFLEYVNDKIKDSGIRLLCKD